VAIRGRFIDKYFLILWEDSVGLGDSAGDTMKHEAKTGGNQFKARWLGAVVGAILLAPVYAQAQTAPVLTKDRPLDAYESGGPFRSWLDMVSASQAAQPNWISPLVTTTPLLVQQFRADFYDQQNGHGTQGNGQHFFNYGGPGGPRVELIPAYNWQVIVAAPPYVTASGPRGTAEGWGDWPAFLVKYRLISANKENGDYIVTAFFQMSDPLGTPGAISNNVLVAQPTLAFGKGWGNFNIQSTISTQIPVDSIGPKPKTGTTVGNFGDPVLFNTSFGYQVFQYFWPQVEVNYTYWPNGIHEGWNQVQLTPGIIFGRFKIGNDTPTRPINLIFGVGYQVAITPNPVVANNVVATVRVNF
jgi:hypothetical protein